VSRVVLVTGAGGGLGAALARRLSESGCDVALHCHTNRKGADTLAQELRKDGHRAEVFQYDLTKPEAAEQMALSVERDFGQLDILVNNAGVYIGGDLDSITPEEWFVGLNSTATATFLATRELLPLLRKSGSGRIVNIGDSSCDRPTARDLAVGYHVGKTGVLILTRSYAKAEAEHGITVNMVSPGYLENSEGLLPLDSMPSGRYGTFDDIWAAVSFLIDPKAAYINGSNLAVSGGWNLR
jgi:NAD(P)-dependent dehydrogenase (short-subunit alcohol dehydrogenase family)